MRHVTREDRALIVTADDFGLHRRVNEAVEQAHLHGVLTSASLMIGAPAASDAVARARCLPSLRVGLHIVLADGVPVLDRQRIPALLDTEGRFGDRMVRDGVRFFFLPHVRRQLAEEIEAQFDAFARTGLPLDHVNTHKHFHLHPTVLSLIVKIGKQYGMRAMRLPYEADAPLWSRPWTALIRRRLQAAGLAFNRHIVGIKASGQMDEKALLLALEQLPAGVSEIYCHPATRSDQAITQTMRHYRHADELDGLMSTKVAAAIRAAAATRGGFSDIFFPTPRG